MAPYLAPNDGRLTSMKALFRSRRSSPLTSTHLSSLEPSDTGQPVQEDEPAGPLTASTVPTVSTSNQARHQTLSVRSPPAASKSTSPALQPPPSPHEQASGASTKPSETTQRDLWSRAAETIDPQVLKKWLLSDSSLRATAEAQRVAEVLESARERARLQQRKAWKRRWSSLVSSISTFNSLVDAGLQFDPIGYGALAWSIVSFGLEAAVSNKEIDDDLVESCEYIRATIDEYSIYEARYLGPQAQSKGRKALENCIVDVYMAVIAYAAEMNYYIQNRADRVVKAMNGSSDSSFVEYKAVIEKRTAAALTIIDDIRNELSESRLKEIQSGIDAILAKANDFSKIVDFVGKQERENMLSWISVLDMDTVHVTQRDKAEAPDRHNPGGWILSHNEYLKWDCADETASLWLTSGVGTGKTISTSTVIEEHRKDSSGHLAYFYCSGAPGNDASAMTAENILKCLLRQFATCSERFFSLVAKKWKESESRGLKALTRLEVLKLLGGIIEDEQTLQATLIVDGLDELDADTLRTLLNSLATLLEAKCGILKVFASSRWVQRIEDIFSAGFCINDIAAKTRGDLTLYVESAVNAETREKNLGNGFIDDIKRTLLERANGMFRYTELAIKYIFGATTKRIRERLESPFLFHRAATLSCDQYKGDPVDQLLARRVIKWLLHQFLPLTDRALLKAISFGVDDEISLKLQSSDIGIDEVKAACHHLVIHNPKFHRFEFGHVSVVEFFQWKSSPALGDLEAHSTMAASCLSFLALQDSSDEQISRYRALAATMYPSIPYHDKGTFERYAILSWIWHWREAQHTPSAALQDLFDGFWFYKSRLQACIEAIDSFSSTLEFMAHPDGIGHHRLTQNSWCYLLRVLMQWKSNRLAQRWFLVCAQDLSSVADDIFLRVPADAGSLLFVAGIKLAVTFGSTRLLELTNSKYFAFSKLHDSGTSLLHHAANLRNAQSIQKCLELFPDAVNLCPSGALKDEWVTVPFLMALRPESRSEETDSTSLELFLKNPKLDLGASDKQGRTALHYSLPKGLDRVILNLALERDPRATFRWDINGRNFMKIAFRHHPQTLASVQAHYAAYDLHSAARTRDIGALDKALLKLHNEKGTAAHQDLLQALLSATEYGTVECMKMILGSPHVDVNDQDEYGFSALMVASRNGKYHAVLELRSRGANVVLETPAGRNALAFAFQAIDLRSGLCGDRALALLKALLIPMTQSPLNINHRDSKGGRTVLHYACERGVESYFGWARAAELDTHRRIDVRCKLLREILSHKPDINIRDRNGETARDVAEGNALFELVNLLDRANISSSQSSDYSSNAEEFATPAASHDRLDIGSFFSFESFDDLCWGLARIGPSYTQVLLLDDIS
ncbi:hypothetical protein EDD37DRAFT_694576 [Exophiala viscosa]|uniref:uncharacterized protein n=1 Tax=Exophiala viscosa TaxID=2486360 RepID=UPI002195D103|nr:hypothetical protein EDD37DRAFT_694576 [Exophiala viscosa]